jgi:ABC-2 type transport system ATP-binding protein
VTAILTVQNVDKAFGSRVVLAGVSFAVDERDRVGIVGLNGAGKSTLMRILATLQEPDAGSVRLGDLDVLKQKDDVRRILGYLPQEFGLYPKVLAIDLLDHFARLKGIADGSERRRVVEALLQQTNLWQHRFKALGGFSGGMKQRFGIAQALLGDPRLIIVDEPTAGLDPEERVRFHNLLAEIGEQKIVILSTHIVGDVSDLCSRMAIIHKGELLATGEPIEVIRLLRGQIWKRFVDKSELPAIQAEHNVISTRLFQGRPLIHVHAPAQPAGFDPVEPDLEDVYFRAIKRHASA